MLPLLGPTLKEKDATKWMASLRGNLATGESVKALSRFNTMRPLTDAIAVTDRRVIAFFSASVGTKGPLIEIASSEIGQADADTKFGGRTLTVHAPGRDPRHIGTLRPDDVSFVVGQVNAIAAARQPETPTVDVYDPFSKPWEVPSSLADVRRPKDVAPPAQNHAPQQPAFEDQLASEPVGVGNSTVGKSKRLVPLWKSVPLLVLVAFFGLFAVVGAFVPEGGLSLFLFFGALALMPTLTLTSIRRRAARRRAKAAGSKPVFGLFERNWIPIGVPLVIVMLIGFFTAVGMS